MKDVVSACPIEDVMRVLSGRWPTLLLYYLKDGVKRFSDLRRDNPTVSHRILALELRKLEQAGIVSRTDIPGYPRRVDYALTSVGLKLVPLIDALGDWWEDTAAARTVSTAPSDAEPEADRSRVGRILEAG
ncbi:MAG TPA: helix-turn-helix domain-containing protein [Caulobacteraceae bacterium]|nr:helix-turn-helix domain-containing protein [Caulobacteraceae bacterium]